MEEEHFPACVQLPERRYGAIRRDNGKVVIPAIYRDINMLSPTLFEVQTNDLNCLLIGASGNKVSNAG